MEDSFLVHGSEEFVLVLTFLQSWELQEADTSVGESPVCKFMDGFYPGGRSSSERQNALKVSDTL